MLRKYWPEYTRIIKKQSWNFHTLYVDAFAGSGKHISRSTGEFVMGSPARALDVSPPFDEYHFIDLDSTKVQSLQQLAAERPNVTVHEGDCNEILLRDVLPLADYRSFRRALCLLDPYSLQLDWNVIATAGRMKSVEIFLNFPIMDINRNVLREGASATKVMQMNRFWGDESWRDKAFHDDPTLFGDFDPVKVGNHELAEAFRIRLRGVAGFTAVPQPLAMRNKNRATVTTSSSPGTTKPGPTS